MKYNSSIFSKKNNSLIHNRFILYFVLIISLADLFYLSVERDFISILSFILIGFLFSFFTKNMLIILFLALTLTNILKFGGGVTSEGFTEGLEIEKKIDNLDKDNDNIENKINTLTTTVNNISRTLTPKSKLARSPVGSGGVTTKNPTNPPAAAPRKK